MTTYASWRWVLFVNVPIGAAVALAAPRVLAETPRRRGRFDLPGALTGTAGITALVYGLISAATSPNGVSHWGDAKVDRLAGGRRGAARRVRGHRNPQPAALLPLRLLRDRNRTGAYLSYAGVGIFIFGMFFFLTVFMQTVWGYSAIKTGVAYLPFTAALFIGAGAVTQLVPRIGARPLLLAGSALSTGGLYWLSRISEHDTYASAVLGPTMVIGAGAALLFVTLSLVALNRVPEADSGVASSLLNTGQQLGGSIGLAVLGTVAWTAVAHMSSTPRPPPPRGPGTRSHPGGPLAAAIYRHAIATGFARGFLVAAGIALLTLVINITVIRVRRADLAAARATGTRRARPPGTTAVTATKTQRKPAMSKTILITGASSGFGRDTAETLRHAGHTVYASMRGVQGKNREAAEALRKLGVKTVELDVSDDTSVEAGVKTVLAEAGKIDVLVNNAGIASAGVTEAFTTEQAKAIFDTNVIGLLRVTRAVLPSMRRQHDGLIINIGSILGRVTFPFVGIYGASKFAVEALTDSLRYEVSQLGVEVVEVQPSGYPTNFFTNIQTPAGIEVTESYGEVGHIPDAMVTSLTSTFEGKDAPNPHDVAEAIVKLVGQAKGSRAVRTVVGAPFGSDQANEDVAPVQSKVVEALGLSHLEKVA